MSKKNLKNFFKKITLLRTRIRRAKKDRFKKSKSFKKDFFVFLFIIICFFVTVFFLVWLKVEIEIANIESSGVIVGLEEELDDRILDNESPLAAIIIDNFIYSRPVIGLSKSLFVWEAPVEAGITRFLAVFPLDSEDEIEKIGPVRSLRPYFIDWAAGLGATITHCGGSPEALEQIESVYARHIDQFYNFNYFWRTWKRDAPHNVLTSTEKLRDAIDEKNYETVEFDSWKFKEDLDILERPKKQEISIDFWLSEHKIKWKYDLRKNDYVRSQGGIIHKDDEGNKIRAKNIIIQFTDVEIIDNEGRREIRTTGEGRASIFIDGKQISAFWEKPSREARTKFYDEHSEEISFNKGATWIEVVPIDMEVVVSDFL